MYHFLYPLLRPVLFQFDPEQAHHLSLKTLDKMSQTSFAPLLKQKIESRPRTVWGLRFKNPVGLAAGLDKNADCLSIWEYLGFGFVEVGTVTPKAQAGNPKPRLFRLSDAKAIINRMGFNSKGADYVVERLSAYQGKLPVGVNIGKNKDTPLENSLDDYSAVLTKTFPFADYICVNISSPNTPALRELQFGEHLVHLLSGLRLKHQQLCQTYHRKTPLLVKISPDLTQREIESICDTVLSTQMDGVVATNTTVSREGVARLKFSDEQGGLSGQPLLSASTAVLAQFSQHVHGKVPLVGVGGVNSAANAQEKFAAGASLVQLYTGFIYQGPSLVRKICSVL